MIGLPCLIVTITRRPLSRDCYGGSFQGQLGDCGRSFSKKKELTVCLLVANRGEIRMYICAVSVTDFGTN